MRIVNRINKKMFYFTKNRCQIKNFERILVKYFGKKKNGFVLDVGAHDGFKWSNSFPVINAGWSGILIEPHPVYVERIRERYKSRPDIKIVESAISDYTGEATLYDAGSLTTLKTEVLKAHAQISWARGHNKNKSYIVKVENLNDVLHNYNVKPGFDLFTLDCEGSEKEVLKFFDIKYWNPKMVIVETMEQMIDNERKILDMENGNFYKFCDNLFSKYEKIYVDGINTIYIL